MFGASVPDYVVDCVEVKRGDAVVVEDDVGNRKTVRVHGIVVPTDHQYVWAAREAARSVARGQRAEVDVVKECRDGSLVARVLIKGRRLGAVLVRNGYAWHDPRQAPDDETLAGLQREARKNGRGLWAHDAPVPPWEHRDGRSDREPVFRRGLRFARSLLRATFGSSVS